MCSVIAILDYCEVPPPYHYLKSSRNVTCTLLSLLSSVVKPAVQNAYRPCRSRKCIWGHIPMHAIFAVFIYFFIPVLSRPSFTFRTPKTRRITLLLSSRPSPIAWRRPRAPQQTFLCMHVICKRSKKCLTRKVARFSSNGPIPRIQPPFNSSCVAL